MSVENPWTGRDWSLRITADKVTLQSASGEEHFPGTSAVALSVIRRWFRWQLVVRGGAVRRLPGLTKSDALALRTALIAFMASNRNREAREQHARAVGMFRPAVASVVAWYDRVNAFLRLAEADQRWVTQEQLEDLLPPALLSDATKLLAEFPSLEAGLAAAEREAIAFLDEDLPKLVAKTNEQTLTLELTGRRTFFDTVESSPLTQEQARAVVCFDNRVHVVAAAGSGKTSVMVARAAYAIERGFVAPERILLLAFNKDAATELQERIAARLSALGLDASGLRASTFHSFGLAVIGKATGIKPRLAPWLDGGQDVAMVCRIVDELRDGSVEFRYKWDLYRLLFARMADSPDGGEVDNYDRATKVSGFRTYKGETVKSQGERMLADWLYLNGVNYEYERPYAHIDVADRDHSQYRPDFYYPDVDVWHEHWALDRDGVPPASFTGYAESMRWKKQIHRQHGTKLVETTWAEIIDNSGFGPFSDELTQPRSDSRLEPGQDDPRRQATQARGSGPLRCESSWPT